MSDVDRSGVEPGLRAFLQAEDAYDGPPLVCLSPGQARAAFGHATRAWWGPVDAVGAVADIEVPGSSEGIRARVYTPATVGPHPGVVFFHGGGWVVGDLDTHDGPCRSLCNRAQAVVVSVEYRKAPEHPFPVPLDDAWQALRWVRDNSASLGFGADALVVAGESAGANLAAVVARRARDAGIELAAQVLVYPVTDCVFRTESYRQRGEGFGLTGSEMRWFFDHYARGQDWAQSEIAPLRIGDLSGLPPAYLVTCEFDPLRDEGRSYAERLRAAGVPVVHQHLADAIHGVFLMNAVTPVTATLIGGIARYVCGITTVTSTDVARGHPGHEPQEVHAIEAGHRPVVDDSTQS